MGNVQLAFLWHFHQPCYRDLPSGKFLMPWVRLHGVKDYTGMVAILEEFPKIRCTANFSGVLLDQIGNYVKGDTDTMLDLAVVPAAALNDEQKATILKTFFWAHPETVIGAYPRFRELLELHRRGKPLREQDFLDLQVLANLAWFHPTIGSVEALRLKGRGFTEEDKAVVVAKTREVMGQILPRWRALGDRAELSVSPHYHPIVPLLCDFASAREAIPDLPLPDSPSLREEAEVQVRRALDAGERDFGRRPPGMWPSEGSVSQEACELFARCGVRWVATDQAILGEPGVRMLGSLKVAFRDAVLSNLIGFTYKTMDPEEAARDFVRRLEEREGPVPVILDGENPWEHFPGGGIPFLRALFRALSDHPRIRTVTMSEIPATGRIDRIFAGSWINRNFGVWIGHPEDRKGWELLGRAYEDLKGTNHPMAMECIRAAEGSDWFWWFGEDFSSAQDAEFDALFRRHLMNAYRAVGRPWPEDVQQPVKRTRREIAFKTPADKLRVKVDGRRSGYFEWIGAGHYDMSREFSALAGESSFIADVFYGFNQGSLLVRLDLKEGVDPKGALAEGELRVVVTRPRQRSLPIRGVADEIFEAEVPFGALGVRPGEDVEFFLEFERPGGVPVRVPTLAPLYFQVPTADYDRIHWKV